MKKEFVYLSKVMTAAVFTALSLTSCSEDLVGNEDNGSAGTGIAVFSNGVDNVSRVGLKTTMDETGTFFWSAGDYIFVKNGNSYVKSDNAATSKVERTNFYLHGTFNAPVYPVVFTGTGTNTTPDKVTVKAAQNQQTANDATHIGTDGDCGNALASQTGELSYKFDLNHRASYLVITPRHALQGAVKLQKIEVSTSGSDNLCGTYTFSENTTTLKEETATSTGKKVTLTTGNWNVPTVEAVEASFTAFDGVRGFMVIQPGTHTLTFTYYVTVDGTARTFSKVVRARDFIAGAYTNVKHILADGIFDGGHNPAIYDPNGEISDEVVKYDFNGGFNYMQWGAQKDYLKTWETNAYNTTTNAPTQLSTVPWSDLPNANEMYWYAMNGDPRWDNTVVWTIDGGQTEYTGGIWIMKKSAILAAGKTFDSAKGKDDVDMRTALRTHEVSTKTYKSAGKPSEIDKYFFLPAQGEYVNGTFYGLANYGCYWSKSPSPIVDLRGYDLFFRRNGIVVTHNNRYYGYVVAPGWFK